MLFFKIKKKKSVNKEKKNTSNRIHLVQFLNLKAMVNHFIRYNDSERSSRFGVINL